MKENPIIEIHKTMEAKMSETVDNFIFEYINPWCEELIQHKLSKKMLERALLEYKDNHPEEFRSEDKE